MDPLDRKIVPDNDSDRKKEYTPPEISHEIELETKAGSPSSDELPPGLGGG
jgi:hypothetical protein